jgi:signal transduction histidine kinase
MVVAPSPSSALDLKKLMWSFPYICLLTLVMSPSWSQTIWFGIVCAVFASLVMWIVYRLRLRRVARAIRVCFDERLAQRTRITSELYDTMLQTVQGSKFVADDALEKSSDTDHTRLALEKLSSWLGQAMQEGQEALNSLPTSIEEDDD